MDFWNVAHLWVKYLTSIFSEVENLNILRYLLAPSSSHPSPQSLCSCPHHSTWGWGAGTSWAGLSTGLMRRAQVHSWWVQHLALWPICDFIYLFLNSGTVPLDRSVWTPVCWEQRLSLCTRYGYTVWKSMLQHLGSSLYFNNTFLVVACRVCCKGAAVRLQPHHPPWDSLSLWQVITLNLAV